MSYFQFEDGIDECLDRFNEPIRSGPAPRWQRKMTPKKHCNPPLSPFNTNCLSRTPFRTPRSTKKKARTPIKTPKKTPQRSPNKSTPLVDRFIPNRATMDNDKCYYQLVNNDPVSEMNEGEMSPLTHEQYEYERTVKDNLNADTYSDSRILHFKQSAPTAREGYQNNLRVIYCQNKGSSTKAKFHRFVPKAPEKILDAPGLLNDFYLNLLDWGSNDCLALGLHGSVYIWDAATCSTKHLVEMEQGDYVSSVQWTNEGNILAVGNSNTNIEIWDVSQGKLLRSMSGHSARVGSLSWNAHRLASGSRNGTIHNHDVRIANHLISTLYGHTQDVCGLSWSPDGRTLASGGNDNLVNVWLPGATSEHTPVHSLTDHMAAVKAVSWCPWQLHTLATGGGTADRHIRFWNGATGTCLNSLDAKSQVSSILWSKEHREVISGHGYSQFQLSIWKYPSMVRLADLTGHKSRVLQLAMSPDGSHVASAGADETVRIWNCFERDQSKKRKSGASTTSRKCNLTMINKIR